MRRELLDEAGAFADLAAAQQAIDGWVHSYKHQRPHQSLDMAVSASLFRPRGALPATAPGQPTETSPPPRPPDPMPPAVPAVERPQHSSDPVEFEALVPPSGIVTLAGQYVWVGRPFAGRTVTFWVDQVSIHIVMDGLIFKTVTSRLSENHLDQLRGRGARPAGPAPAVAALPAGSPLPPTVAVEVDRTATRDGTVKLARHTLALGAELAGARITLRIEGNLIHAISNGHLAKTLPSPIPAADRSTLVGARRATQPLPPPPPSGPITVQRRVPRDGVTMVANQRLRVGRTYAGKTVTVVVEDTHFRIFDGATELAVHPRTSTKWVRIYKAGVRQNPSSMSR